ncbi:MAG: carboxyl transferase domain-containing protein [Candidatus Hydrogenedentes bacterium]|jgi:acetyl-CoA carboxylase carboxyltransferase component|nr:carboxyl transferase domain-containing protein [Candidatus Hydrogenedentota bacterium]
MSWEPEIEELRRREHLARQMGGPEGIARQRKRGKLTVRERIDLLADPGSFREMGMLGGTATYENNRLTGFTPKGAVNGMVALDGRKAVVSAGDFTVRGGSGGGPSMAQQALEWRLPFIRLLDAAGGSVKTFETLGRTYLPDGNAGSMPEVKLLSVVPVVSAVLGSVAGLPAVNACMAHFSLMVKDLSHLFPGGPPVVKAALKYDITKEELGGEHIHVYESGVADNLADTEEDAFKMIRRYLSYLPSNIWEMAPRNEPTDDPERRDEELLSAIPREKSRAYDVYKILHSVLDRDSLFEISPFYGRSRITALARVNGYPVAVMANNPMHLGGATDVAGGSKVVRLMQLCDTFHIPLISFADEPGFMVGLEEEKRGIERVGARLVCATCDSQMPWLTIVMRQVYGVAGQCQQRPSGMFRRYAWPSGAWGSMHIEGGAYAAYRREIETAPDPEAKRKDIEAMLKALTSPFRTAEATGQDIIDPRETRPLLCEFVEEAQAILRTQLGTAPAPYRP